MAVNMDRTVHMKGLRRVRTTHYNIGSNGKLSRDATATAVSAGGWNVAGGFSLLMVCG